MKTAPESIAGFVGWKGSGKTTLAAFQIAPEFRSVTFDPNNDRALQVGRRIVRTPVELATALSAAGTNGPLALCWQGFLLYGTAAFEMANQLVYSCGNVAVLWDEADRYAPSKRDLPWWAGQMVNTGRHVHVGIYFTTRQPRKVESSLRANADRLCVFQTFEPADAEYLRDLMAPSEDRREFAERLSALKKYEALDWQAGAGAAVIKKSVFS